MLYMHVSLESSYLQKGRDLNRIVPPDTSELNAHIASYVSEKLQSKKSAGVNAPLLTVPSGLSPIEHFNEGLNAKSPLDMGVTVPHDIEFCLQKFVSSDVEAFRKSQFDILETCINHCRPIEEHLNSLRSEASIKCSMHVSPIAHIVAAYAIMWPDNKLHELILQGVSPLGPQEPIGIYRKKITNPSFTLEQLAELNKELVKSFENRKPPPTDQALAIWENSVADQKAGILSDFYNASELDAIFGVGNWLSSTRFAIMQKDKWRLIDDASQGHNQTFGASEQIHTTSAAAAAAVTQRYRAICGARLRKGRSLRGASSDMKKAYKQISISKEQLRFAVIVIYNIETHKWVYAISWALPFGMSGAVLHFNRVPAFIVALCRRWMAIPVQNFFDDFRIIEPQFLKGSGFKWFKKITNLLGWHFDPDKDHAPSVILPMLGNIENWSKTDADQFLVQATPERILALKTFVISAINNKKCTKTMASSLRGRLVHIAATRPARTGRAYLANLSRLADHGGPTWSEEIHMELLYILKDLDGDFTKVYPLFPCTDIGPRVWTDASFEPAPLGQEAPKMRLCAIVANSSARAGVVVDISPEFYLVLEQRETQITIGEMLGVMMAFKHYSSVLKSQSVICYGDNMGVIHAIVNGICKARDVSAFVLALQHKIVNLKCSVWWEYVASASNLADGGSRDGISCTMAESLGIPLKFVECHLPPKGFPALSPEDWDSWW